MYWFQYCDIYACLNFSGYALFFQQGIHHQEISCVFLNPRTNLSFLNISFIHNHSKIFVGVCLVYLSATHIHIKFLSSTAYVHELSLAFCRVYAHSIFGHCCLLLTGHILQFLHRVHHHCHIVRIGKNLLIWLWVCFSDALFHEYGK